MSEFNVDKFSSDAAKRSSMISAAARGSDGPDPRIMRELRSVISNTVSEYQSSLILYDGDLVGFREDMRSFINSLERLYKQWVIFESL